MKLDSEYIRISDLFEGAVSRAAQLASLSVVLQEAMASPDSDPKALYITSWLLAELLREQHILIEALQDAHRKDFLSRRTI